jgi:hypothetical protein
MRWLVRCMKLSVNFAGQWVPATVVEALPTGFVRVEPSTMNGHVILMPRIWLRIDHEDGKADDTAINAAKPHAGDANEPAYAPESQASTPATDDTRPSMPVSMRSPTARRVSATTKLLPGISLLHEHGRMYHPVVVVEAPPGGHVKIHYPGWGQQRDELVPRNTLWVEPTALRAQFKDKADGDADRPASPSDTRSSPVGEPASSAELTEPAGSSAGLVRIWTDKSGEHKVEAELLAFDDDKVTLKRIDNGKLVTMPMEKLSAADQEFVRRSAAARVPQK